MAVAVAAAEITILVSGVSRNDSGYGPSLRMAPLLPSVFPVAFANALVTRERPPAANGLPEIDALPPTAPFGGAALASTVPKAPTPLFIWYRKKFGA